MAAARAATALQVMQQRLNRKGYPGGLPGLTTDRPPRRDRLQSGREGDRPPGLRQELGHRGGPAHTDRHQTGPRLERVDRGREGTAGDGAGGRSHFFLE